MANDYKQFMEQAAKRRARAVKLYKGGKGKTQQQIADIMSAEGPRVTRQRVGQWLNHEKGKAKA